MKNKQLRSFFIGLSISILIMVSFFTGAIADRIFVIKPLDYFAARTDGWLKTRDKIGSSFSKSPLGQILQPGGEYSIADVAEKASESVVTVSIKKQQRVLDSRGIFEQFGIFGFEGPNANNGKTQEIQRDIGTGFVVDGEMIVTNKHVVSDAEAEYLVIDKNNQEYQVKKIYRDPANDLAILQVDGLDLPAFTLGDSNHLRVGESVIAIGTALGEFRHTVTTGVISGLGRGITASDGFTQLETLEGVIQTDAAINPGNSGGPLINNRGEVIGVNVATSGADNISFAIPINVIKSSIENFNATGKFERPFMGVRYQMISEQAALLNEVPQGAYILEVVDGSSAAEAGIKVGDIIVEFIGRSLKDNDLATIINQQKIGDKVKIKFWRDKEEKTIELVLKGQGE